MYLARFSYDVLPVNNGQVAVTISFTAAAGSTAGYNVIVDGTTVAGGPFPYASSGATTCTWSSSTRAASPTASACWRASSPTSSSTGS